MGWIGMALLAVGWLVLLAPALRPQRRGSPLFTAHSFRRSMGALAGGSARAGGATPRRAADGRVVLVPKDAARIAGTRASARPRRPSPATQRRLAVLRALISAVAVSVVAWLGVDAVGAGPLVVSVSALTGYCALLAASAQRRAGRRRPPARRGGVPRGASPRSREVVVDDPRVAHGA